ncbi:MAG: hypothetical protein WD737_14470 [Gemmatimonadota bacterium]
MAEPARSGPNLTFAYLSGAAFVGALLIAAFFIAFADRLAFITSALYYVLLMPIALAAAAFLFGALRSHARYRGQVAKGTLELGGPVVVFAMVLLGGLLLANPESTANLTVRLSGSDGQEIVSEGQVVLDLGDDRRTRAVGPDGQVTFAQVPLQFLSGEVGVIATADRYRMKRTGPFPIPPSGVIEVEMERIPDETSVSGTILGVAGPIAGALVNFRDGLVTTRSDENGNFSAVLPFAEGAVVPVTVLADGRTVYDDNYVVSETTGLRIRLAERGP